MLNNKLKLINTYGIPTDVFESCFDIIQEGNDKSLSAVVVLDSIFMFAMTIYNYYKGRPIRVAAAIDAAAILIAILFFVLGPKCKRHHHIFYFLTVQTMLFYGVYFMAFEAYNGGILYFSVVMLLPLFYMHRLYTTMCFFSLNGLVFLWLAYFGPEHCKYMKLYVFPVMAFTLIGVGIHYLYQSNRMREFISYREIQEKQNALEISSTFETMTGLLRRRKFIQMAEETIERRKQNQYMMIGILDVDHFKLINDTYGHQLGDETIRMVGDVIAKELDISLFMPPNEGGKFDINDDYGNIAGRLGGDEFIFLISSEKGKSEVTTMVNQLLQTLNATSVGPLNEISASIGLSELLQGEKSYDEFYREADLALYHSKTNGRNQISFYSKDMEKEMEHKQHENEYDGLTGLLATKYFKKYAKAFLEENKGGAYAIANFDIDNFKAYNSRFGFERGDQLLQKLAEVLTEQFPTGILSRFADDHFVTLVPLEELETKAENLIGQIEDFDEDYKNTLRVGVFTLENSDIDINVACDRAKFACDTIRNRYDISLEYFDKEVHKKIERSQHIISHLDEALEKEWIQVFYQPIVRTYTGEICGLEALSRWQDPDLGILPPGDFIEVLEQTRLIYKLDLYMVKHVCRHYATCEAAGIPMVPVSVNLSRLDFESVDVVDEIETVISQYNVPRSALHIEITESALVEQEDSLKQIVDKFQNLNYQIWMDDFGAGYSSLNVLKDYQFNVIKFDMEFMRDAGDRARTVLTSIVDMAKKLGLQTLAEGVETEEQYEFLKTIGCEFVQGYLFSKPLPAEFIYEKAQNNQLRIENRESTNYYNEIGKKNVLENVLATKTESKNYSGNSRAVAILEWKNDEAKFLMMSPSFKKLVRSNEDLTYRDVENLLNDRNNPVSEPFIKDIKRLVIEKGIDKRVLNYRGTDLMLYANYLTYDEREQKTAILVGFSDITSNV